MVVASCRAPERLWIEFVGESVGSPVLRGHVVVRQCVTVSGRVSAMLNNDSFPGVKYELRSFNGKVTPGASA